MYTVLLYNCVLRLYQFYLYKFFNMRNEKKFSFYKFLRSSVFDLLDNKNKLSALFFNVPSFREAVYEIYEEWFIEFQKSIKQKEGSYKKWISSNPELVKKVYEQLPPGGDLAHFSSRFEVGILRIFDQNKNLIAVFPSNIGNYSISNSQKISRSFLENELTIWIESLLQKSESDKLTDLYFGFIDYDYFIFNLNFENIDSFPSTPIRSSISLLEDVFRKWEPSSLTEIYTFEIITADIFLTMLSKNRMMAFFNNFPKNTPGISPSITKLLTLKKGNILKKPTEFKIVFSQNKTRIRKEFEILAQQRNQARKNWLKEFSLIYKNHTSQVLLLPKKVNPSIQKIMPIPYWTPQVGLFFICWIQVDLLHEIFKNYLNQNTWFKEKRKELLEKYEQFEVDTQIAAIVRQHLQQYINP